jgi:hypothetical protein
MSDVTYGITIGIGIPFIIIVVIILRGLLCPMCLRAEHKKLGLYNVSKNSEKTIQKELSPKAFEDFKKGKLTQIVYNEINYIYSQKKYLDDYIVFASKHKHDFMLVFLRDPKSYPMAVSTNV